MCVLYWFCSVYSEDSEEVSETSLSATIRFAASTFETDARMFGPKKFSHFLHFSSHVLNGVSLEKNLRERAYSPFSSSSKSSNSSGHAEPRGIKPRDLSAASKCCSSPYLFRSMSNELSVSGCTGHVQPSEVSLCLPPLPLYSPVTSNILDDFLLDCGCFCLP